MEDRLPGIDEGHLPGTGGLDARAMWTLLAGNALSAVGIGFFLPILPLFLKSRGSSAFLIGVVFAGGVVGRLLAQYPAGRLSDRFGRRPVLVAAMLGYALIFPVYLLPMPTVALIVLRFVHAFVGGCYGPAAMALVADLAPEGRRASAFGRMRASDMAGLLLGPALGGLVAGFRLDAIFIAGFLICLAGTLLLLRLPKPPPLQREEVADDAPQLSALALLRLLLPVIALAAPAYWTYGTYDTVWSLYLTSRGATPFVVGLSFATYALPIVLLGGHLGGLADRIGHLRAAVLTLLVYGLLASSYAFVASVVYLVLIGVVEGGLSAAGQPALQAMVSERAPRGAQGRTQGVYGAALGVAELIGAVAAGGLYTLSPRLPFFGITAVCLIGVSVALATRRVGSPRRAATG